MTDSLLGPNAEPATAIAPDMPAAKPAPSKYAWLTKLAYTLIALIMGGISILKFVTRNDLPGCDYGKTRDLLGTIFKNKNVEYKTINEGTTVSSSDDLITCKSSVTMSDGTMLIDYKIARDGDKYEVQITSARAQ